MHMGRLHRPVYACRQRLKGRLLQLPLRNCALIAPPDKAPSPPQDAMLVRWQTFAVYLGVLGFCAQGFLEFGLYLPALAWPAFTLLGWLLSAD